MTGLYTKNKTKYNIINQNIPATKALNTSEDSCSLIILLRPCIQRHERCCSFPVLERDQSRQSCKTNDHSPVYYEMRGPSGKKFLTVLKPLKPMKNLGGWERVYCRLHSTMIFLRVCACRPLKYEFASGMNQSDVAGLLAMLE